MGEWGRLCKELQVLRYSRKASYKNQAICITHPPPLSNWGRETKKTTEFDIFCKVTHQFIINLKTFDWHNPVSYF